MRGAPYDGKGGGPSIPQRRGEQDHASGNTTHQQRFEGYCGHCGRWGHRQRDCLAKGSVSQLDGDNAEDEEQNSPTGSPQSGGVG